MPLLAAPPRFIALSYRPGDGGVNKWLLGALGAAGPV
jgi:hypothetical protein